MTFKERVREFKRKASEFILAEAGIEGKAGDQKLEDAAVKLGKWLDDKIKASDWLPAPFGALVELFDGKVFTEISRWAIQLVYDWMKEAGEIA